MNQTDLIYINSRQLRTLFGGISDMTWRRWVDRNVIPPPTKINGRNYWRRSDVEPQVTPVSVGDLG